MKQCKYITGNGGKRIDCTTAIFKKIKRPLCGVCRERISISGKTITIKGTGVPSNEAEKPKTEPAPQSDVVLQPETSENQLS